MILHFVKIQEQKVGKAFNKNYFMRINYCNCFFLKDLDIARCLRNLNVFPNKSIDSLGRERFHPLSIYDHFNGNIPDWLKSYASNPVANVNKINNCYVRLGGLLLRHIKKKSKSLQ